MIRRLIVFVREVRAELGKVSWASRPELLGSTWVVMFSSILLALFVGAFDFVCTTVMQWILR